jgi:hypothetical protein
MVVRSHATLIAVSGGRRRVVCGVEAWESPPRFLELSIRAKEQPAAAATRADFTMLSSISLKFTEVQGPVVVPAQGVTIFVGPNNAGKSLVLRELEKDISSASVITTKLLSDFEIVWLDEVQLSADITNLTKKAPAGTSSENIYVGRFNPKGDLDASNVNLAALTQFMNEHSNKRWIAYQFLRFFLIRLDGRTRFELTNDRPRGDLLGQAQNMLVHLFKDNEARKRVSDIVYDAFGVYFTVEQLSAQELRIRLSQTKPDADEQNWNDAARAFHG